MPETEIGRTYAETLEEKGMLLYSDKSSSMRPLLRPDRDLTVIRKKDGRCRKYDVVLYQRRDDRYALQRVLRLRARGYWVAGDNCDFGESVSEDQVLGVMTEIIRGKKELSVSERKYRLYVRLWCAPYPLRFLLIKLRNCLCRCRRKEQERSETESKEGASD